MARVLLFRKTISNEEGGSVQARTWVTSCGTISAVWAKELGRKVEEIIIRTVYQIYGKGLLLAGLGLFIWTQAVSAQTWTQTLAPTNWWQCIASSADGSKLVAGQWIGGIYVSTNSGNTWTPTMAPTNTYWASVASSADGCKLVAAAFYNPNDGLYTSTNSGATWVSNNVPPLSWCSVASSADGNTLVAAAAFEGSGFSSPGILYSSTNGGVNWSPCVLTNSIYPYYYYNFNPVGVTASADGKKFAVVATYGLFCSTNSGISWTQETNAPNLGAVVSPSQYIASSADGTKLVLCTGDPGLIYVSTNSGYTWNLTSAPNYQWEFVTMSANGNTIMVVSAYYQTGPIFISTNSGDTWTTNGPILGWGSVATSADGGKLAAAAEEYNWGYNSGPIFVSQSVVAPQMAIQPTNGSVQLLWLVPSTNFVLQESSDLATWTDTTNCPILDLDNLQDEVTVPSTNSTGFYRLKGP